MSHHRLRWALTCVAAIFGPPSVAQSTTFPLIPHLRIAPRHIPNPQSSVRNPVRRAENRDESIRLHAPDAESALLRSAYACRGVPYRFGGMSRGGFDCSGFVSYLYRLRGVSLPRTASEQFQRGKAVSHDEMRPGDLVFFHTTRPGISHVGMYVGKGRFIHASTRAGVRTDSLEDGYYRQRFRGARRMK